MAVARTEYTQSGNSHFLHDVHFIMMVKSVQLRGQIHSPYFSCTPLCTLW
jgi:hypothetical protein